MSPHAAVALRKVELAKAALANALLAGAQEYANGGNRAEPIVRRHFTAGNEGRYNWPPLSPEYAAWKAGGTEKTTGGVAFLTSKQRQDLATRMGHLSGVVGAARKRMRAKFVNEIRGGIAASKADKGASIGKGVRGPGLPMLVLSGRMRDAVSGGRATVTPVTPGLVRIVWTGLPEYAKYHHEGAGKLPKRSPVEPNAQDRAAIILAAKRYLTAQLGTAARGVPGLGAGRGRLA